MHPPPQSMELELGIPRDNGTIYRDIVECCVPEGTPQLPTRSVFHIQPQDDEARCLHLRGIENAESYRVVLVVPSCALKQDNWSYCVTKIQTHKDLTGLIV
jgi:hypothetical protein